MAVITPELITSLRTGFNDVFQRAIEDTPTDYQRVATVVPSSNASNTYGWLGQFPKLEEWVGERQARNMRAYGYSIVNKLYEAMVSVRRVDIEDDNVAIYRPLISEMGRAARSHADELVFTLLKNGESETCYDGKPFFSTEHPVYPTVSGEGTPVNVANLLGPTATGTAWYLLDTSRALRPLIFQERTRPELQTLMDVEDEGVFMRDEYRYGVRYRCNAGFGFWQMAVKSKETLNADNFNEAVKTMQEFRADGGRPLGISPTVLVVPPSLRAAAIEIVKNERLANGASNPNFGIVDLIVSPWLI